MPKGGRGKSAISQAQSKRNEPIDYSTQPRDKPSVVVDPLTPRPKVFAVLLIVFAVWMAFLVFLYFKTVYPHRSTAPKSEFASLAGGQSNS